MTVEERLIDANKLLLQNELAKNRSPVFRSYAKVLIDSAPTVVAIPVTEEELKHLINDTIAYIWKMESDGREGLTDSRKALLEKLERFRREHFSAETDCFCREEG